MSFFEEKSVQWRKEQDEILRRIEKHQGANQTYLEEGVRILELSQHAVILYEKQNPHEQRRLLNFVLSNSIWKDGKLIPNYRKPFDLLAVTNLEYQKQKAISTSENGLFDFWLHPDDEKGNAGPPAAGQSDSSGDDQEPTILEWPELQPEAMRGLARDFVELATRKYEADPVAVLMTFLCWFAVEVGSSVFLRVGDTRHYARVFTCIVGDTSKARKGTSHGPVKRLFAGLSSHTSHSSQERYVCARCTPGPLSTGEGIIYAVRDPVEKLVGDKKTGEMSFETVDPGVSDKRLFVCDEELGGALSCTRREGNTLSTVLRCAWDHGSLDPLTKTSKITATGAHIGIVGHITRAELRRKLEEAEAFNGFANRFLWVCARRHGLVPFPEPMPLEELKELQRRLYRILMAGKDVGEMSLSLPAQDYWTEIYPEISEDRDGLAGAVINRGEAQLLRLGMIYALLDGSATIEVDHMRAAKAVWDYCRESAEYIFHGFEADPVATRILDQVHKNGEVEWKDLYSFFSNHVSKIEIDTAVNDLTRRGKLVLETVATGGRPKRILRLAQTQARNSEANSTETSTGEQSDQSEHSPPADPEKWVEEF